MDSFTESQKEKKSSREREFLLKIY